MYVKLKKKFGQNFLIDKNITNKISNLIKWNIKSNSFRIKLVINTRFCI